MCSSWKWLCAATESQWSIIVSLFYHLSIIIMYVTSLSHTSLLSDRSLLLILPNIMWMFLTSFIVHIKLSVQNMSCLGMVLWHSSIPYNGSHLVSWLLCFCCSTLLMALDSIRRWPKGKRPWLTPKWEVNILRGWHLGPCQPSGKLNGRFWLMALAWLMAGFGESTRGWEVFLLSLSLFTSLPSLCLPLSFTNSDFQITKIYFFFPIGLLTDFLARPRPNNSTGKSCGLLTKCSVPCQE